MNVKSLLVIGLGLATVGLSLPAHADTATDVKTIQTSVVTGVGNDTAQGSYTRIDNSKFGVGNTGTAIVTDQATDVQGKFNRTTQIGETSVDNSERGPRFRR
jgi:hypothetical protein